MTVSTTISEIVHTGNGSATTFPTNFKLLAEEDLLVKLRVIATGVETTLTLDVDYSISNIANESGSTVTYPLSGSPMAATHQLVLERIIAYTQTTSIRNQSGFFAKTIEDTYDRIVMMVQQILSINARSLRMRVGTALTNFIVPEPENGKVLVWVSGELGNQTIGTISIEDGDIITAKLADAAVTTVKVADNAITTAKIEDAGLKSIAGLITAADKMIYTTDLDTYSVTDLTAAARVFLALNNPSAGQRLKLVDGALAWFGGSDGPDAASSQESLSWSIDEGSDEIRVYFEGLSSDTANNGIQLQISTSATYVTSGYESRSATVSGANTCAVITGSAGFYIYLGSTGFALTGEVILRRVPNTNVWNIFGTYAGGGSDANYIGGQVDAGGEIDAVRIFPALTGSTSAPNSGTQGLFDAGEAGIIWG